jgi:hypothetical protein
MVEPQPSIEMTKKFIIVVSVPVSNEGRTEWSERVRAIIQGATIFLRASAHECADSREVINGSHVVSLVALSRGNLIAKMQHFALGYAANGFGLLMVPRPLVREVLCAEDVDCLAVPCDVENRPQSARPIRLAEELCALLGEPIVTGCSSPDLAFTDRKHYFTYSYYNSSNTSFTEIGRSPLFDLPDKPSDPLVSNNMFFSLDKVSFPVTSSGLYFRVGVKDSTQGDKEWLSTEKRLSFTHYLIKP